MWSQGKQIDARQSGREVQNMTARMENSENARINRNKNSSDDAPPERSAGSLKLENVARFYGALEVFQGLNLEIAGGEFVAIVGPSGCGKSTLLHLMSGHEKASAGTVFCDGRARTVYQSDGLFPWLSVAANIEMGLREIADESERHRQRDELIQLIQLEGFASHYPHQLSGGMRQRVEIARALAGSSDILLLDEPFSALDYITRLRMRNELARLLHERPRTVVFVTHDLEEACHLADRVVVLSERPTRICEQVRIPLPRPRDPMHPLVVSAVAQILDALGLRENSIAARQSPP